jgi:hypothetical protein
MRKTKRDTPLEVVTQSFDSLCSALPKQPEDISFTDKILENCRTDGNTTTSRRNIDRWETSTHDDETSLDGLYTVASTDDINVEVHSHLCSWTIAPQRLLFSFEDMRWEVTALVAAETTTIRLDRFSLFYLTTIGCRLLWARIVLT